MKTKPYRAVIAAVILSSISTFFGCQQNIDIPSKPRSKLEQSVGDEKLKEDSLLYSHLEELVHLFDKEGMIRQGALKEGGQEFVKRWQDYAIINYDKFMEMVSYSFKKYNDNEGNFQRNPTTDKILFITQQITDKIRPGKNAKLDLLQKRYKEFHAPLYPETFSEVIFARQFARAYALQTEIPSIEGRMVDGLYRWIQHSAAVNIWFQTPAFPFDSPISQMFEAAERLAQDNKLDVTSYGEPLANAFYDRTIQLREHYLIGRDGLSDINLTDYVVCHLWYGRKIAERFGLNNTVTKFKSLGIDMTHDPKYVEVQGENISEKEPIRKNKLCDYSLILVK